LVSRTVKGHFTGSFWVVVVVIIRRSAELTIPSPFISRRVTHVAEAVDVVVGIGEVHLVTPGAAVVVVVGDDHLVVAPGAAVVVVVGDDHLVVTHAGTTC